MVPMRKDSPHVPISPSEIIADAKRCRDAGATILHLHAREPDGTPTYKREIYAEIFAGVRDACPDVLISGSCSGRVFGEFWQRSEVLDEYPEYGSLTLGSLNFPTQASVNSPEMIKNLALAMKQRGIRPELEIFDLGMADYANFLLDKGIIERPLYANILLGSLGTASATADNLCAVIRGLPSGTTWAATGVGRFQFFINSLAVTMGGHVRVGLEDALFYDWEKKELATNAGLIDRVTRLARSAGREIASPEQARQLLGFDRPSESGHPRILKFPRAA
jgi:uncharacterized protein (DUF849 family)